ncbi:capsular polysaccharide biosynthesis protein [Maritimibacter dapengensis]|uniref:Capsular polysaccharide biosynthesis protein n=1 Tax=Maritimibacter dapengensis TaxID=2836868 RepID=A0ABS6T0N1_9RHOB|nr:capsular polysaccharide biosynthesis protein [Maritimibacter dapengensis]MBV7378303.1 capsular polysaccharide biosynthesis protein [Maritimibacter dapengensis]
MPPGHNEAAGTEPPSSRRLFVYSGGFLRERRVRRILSLAGWEVKLGLPTTADTVAIWGASPTSSRGMRVAEARGAGLLRVEDAFLRSVLPGRSGAPAQGLLLDRHGVHFDPSVPSDLERMLAEAPLDDFANIKRARDVMDRLRTAHISKYNDFDPVAALPPAPYVVVIDQTRDDAAVLASGATPSTFREMLVMAQEENPGMRVLIKTHPETEAGHRPGYYGPEHAVGHVSLMTEKVSPWALMEGAVAVYTVSSGMGFEAIIAGHKPRVFGQPFYAGWGLTNDENPVPRRTRTLTRAQLVSAALIDYPTWYDPYRDRLCEVEDVLANLEAQARAHREDAAGYVAAGMRLWKRAPVARFFGTGRGVVFAEGDAARARATKDARALMVWANKADTLPAPALRIEDGFVRSRGLGAELTPPLSLVRDDVGVYYDPTRPSRLEALIAASERLSPGQRARAEQVVERLVGGGIDKYNLDRTTIADLPPGHRILVPGQVEDDASILLGTSQVCDNQALLAATRDANPNAILIYKPHPDVESGLRTGALGPERERGVADVVAENANGLALIEAVDEVWTMTSLMGFEALIRGKNVACFGAPFYAGWGLTRDFGSVPERRTARPDLTALAHAVLIDYPRYFDPVTRRPCPIEVALDRIESAQAGKPPGLSLLAKLQGMMAGRSHLWRR